MEYRKSIGVQFVAFSRVLRRVCKCMCTAGKGRGGGAKKEVIGKQEHSKSAWCGLWHLFMTGKSEKLGAHWTH